MTERALSDREAALRLCPVLNQAAAELEVYEKLLQAWQKKINLVSASTLPALWRRHFADSAQLIEAFPKLRRWVDLGSGAGFPGLVLALLLKPHSDAVVHLIEADQRKAAFLRAVSRETNAPVKIHVGRIEDELPHLAGEVEAVCARALAPLPQLIAWSQQLLLKNALGIFLKGEEWRKELTEAASEFSFDMRAIGSRTHPSARIIIVANDLCAVDEASGGPFLD